MTSAKDATFKALIDEFGEVDRQAKLWRPAVNPHLARRAELLALLEAHYENFPAEQSHVAEGQQYQVEVSARQNVREWTAEAKEKAFNAFRKLKVVKAGKVAQFDVLSVFDCTFDSIKKHLGQAFLDSIAPQARTGRRTYNVAAKTAPALTKKAA